MISALQINFEDTVCLARQRTFSLFLLQSAIEKCHEADLGEITSIIYLVHSVCCSRILSLARTEKHNK